MNSHEDLNDFAREVRRMMFRFLGGIIVIVVLVLVGCQYLLAAELSFQWTPNVENTDGYRLYKVSGQGRTLVSDIAGGSVSTATVNELEDTACQTYFLTAYNNQMESGPSNTAGWCPTVTPPAIIQPGTPSTFLITITPVQ